MTRRAHRALFRAELQAGFTRRAAASIWGPAWLGFLIAILLALNTFFVAGCGAGWQPGPVRQASTPIVIPLGNGQTFEIPADEKTRSIVITGDKLTSPPAGGLIPGGENVRIAINASPLEALAARSQGETASIGAQIAAFERGVASLTNAAERLATVALQVQAAQAALHPSQPATTAGNPDWEALIGRIVAAELEKRLPAAKPSTP